MEVGSSENVSSSEKVVLVLLAVEASAVKEGSGFSPSGPGSRLCHQGVCPRDEFGFCHQGWCGFLKQVKGESTSLLVQILFKTFVASRAAGARGSGSVGGLQVGQVWIRSVPSKVRSGFATRSIATDKS